MTTLSFLVLSCGAPTAAIHLLAYFASTPSSLPNINTLKLYFYTPAPVSVSMWSKSVWMRVYVCLCVSMRADAVDAVISHTALAIATKVTTTIVPDAVNRHSAVDIAVVNSSLSYC